MIPAQARVRSAGRGWRRPTTPPPPPKTPLDFEYRLLWQKDPPIRPPSAWVTQTRRGRGYTRNDDGSLGLVIDFDGPALRKLPADAEVEGWDAGVGETAVEIAARVVHRDGGLDGDGLVVGYGVRCAEDGLDLVAGVAQCRAAVVEDHVRQRVVLDVEERADL